MSHLDGLDPPAGTGIRLTASAVVIGPDWRVLLVNHRKYGKWVFPGGHVEVGESPDDTAAREVLEETGIVARIVHRSGPTVVPGTIARPVPWMVTELDGPATGSGNPVRRVDFLYVASADYQPPIHQEDEVADARWVLPIELDSLAVRADVPILAPRAIEYLRQHGWSDAAEDAVVVRDRVDPVASREIVAAAEQDFRRVSGER